LAESDSLSEAVQVGGNVHAVTHPPLRESAPLLDAYLTYREAHSTPFTLPGHKQRAGRLDSGLGVCVDTDVPLGGGLDEIKHTKNVLPISETLAAKLWDGDWARFSSNGSTHANQAILLSLGQPGDRVVISRTAHRSMLIGLVLAGLEPVWVAPEINVATGLPIGIDPSIVASLLGEHDARAVVAIEPGYLGTLSRVDELATVAHAHGVPLVVDQAWGGHLGFHPDVPRHALQLGADAMIISIHKALPGMSGAALAVARTGLLDHSRLEQGFDAELTTSPAGAILASCDGVRALIQMRGEELIGEMIQRAAHLRSRLIAVFGSQIVLSPIDFPAGRFDPSKIVVRTSVIGADGVDVEQDLIKQGIRLEMTDRDTIVAILGLVDSDEEIETLSAALIESLTRRAGAPRPVVTAFSWTVMPETIRSIREAFFAPVEMVSAKQAVGRISADLISPYPPGVPVVAPGELITASIVAGLNNCLSQGTRVAYATDPTLQHFRVLA
jgi:arginine decarboxylase